MAGRTFPKGHLEVLSRLSTQQLLMLDVLGDLDQRAALEGRADNWLRLTEIVAAETTSFDEWAIGELLVRTDTHESLPAFVLRELYFSDNETEQIEALLAVARTRWQWNQDLQSASTQTEGALRPNDGPSASQAPQRRYIDITQWDADIWAAFDTRRERHVYVRSSSRPKEASSWRDQPPRFQRLAKFGADYWRGYDIASGRWMYLEHKSSAVPDESSPGWTESLPATPEEGLAEEEGAPELDEAAQSLVNAVRWGDIRLEDLAAPLRHLDTWAQLTPLGALAELAGQVGRGLANSTDTWSRNQVCRSIADLHAEMERLTSRFAAINAWPTGWVPDRSNGPARYTRMLRLGTQDLRRSVRRIARASPDRGADSRDVAFRATGRPEGQVSQTIDRLLNFCWAMGQDRGPSEWFADPLLSARRLADLPALSEGCPDLASAVQDLGDAVSGFHNGTKEGAQYEAALARAQKLLRDYSKQLLALKDRWPTWDSDENILPTESPTAYAAMMRLGWQILEAERQELRTFVNWQTSLRNPNMPEPKSPGRSRLARVRDSVPKRVRPLAPLTLPSLDNLRTIARIIGSDAFPPEAFAQPLTWVDHWRANPDLGDGYSEFSQRAGEVARVYEQRQSYEGTYKDAVAGLIAVLEAVRVGLGILGSGWPSDWASDGWRMPEQTPAVLCYLIEEGKKELRHSARNLTDDLRKDAAHPKEDRRSRGHGSDLGVTNARRGRHAPRRERGSRRHPSSPVESIRRFLFGSGRRRD
ncbi:hypothetical protein [Streptomyces sp. NPDC057910]|uniref:hypothetical protein n=1 Tax=Streptomyces sp. NPDC057910 TaxID=3346278 RepID=UPI0036F18C82